MPRVATKKAKTKSPKIKEGEDQAIAAIGTGAAAIGVGNLFGQFLQGALRNPSAADGQFGRLIFGFAVTEALGIFSLLVALLALFG